MKSSFIGRSRIILFCSIIFALLLIAKLFLVQIVHSNMYGEAAFRQYATPASDIYERGTIYFSRKDEQLVSAATQTLGFKLAIYPGKITEAENTYKKLSEIVPLDYDDFITKAGKKDVNNPYVNFFAEVFSNINKTLFKNEVRTGDVVSTIEPIVQGFLEKEITAVKEKYQIDSIGGIIMNP